MANKKPSLTNDLRGIITHIGGWFTPLTPTYHIVTCLYFD